MKVAIIVGTRPEIIKMAPVIKEVIRRKMDFILIHSNQHYSFEMDKIFFQELELPEPHYHLNIGQGGSHANQVGNILMKVEEVFLKEKPDVALVQGDTNTVMAAALAATKLQIKVGHIEAGLRSYDKTMPEETNRILTDHMSDYLFAVTETQKQILLSEGIDKKKIRIVGNTVVDSLYGMKDIAIKKSNVLKDLNLEAHEYFLMTAHRASNVDEVLALTELLDAVAAVGEKYPNNKLVWPIHPRTLKRIEENNLEIPSNVISTESLGYLDFMSLLSQSKLVLTDSGGIQEEACILGVPCVTLRENTERPETVDVGGNILVGRNKEKILQAAKSLLAKTERWKNPFGDGTTAKQIIDWLSEDFGLPVFDKAIHQESISVVGMGYMGLPMACLLANAGYKVNGFDISQEKVDKLQKGECPFDEPGMEELLQSALDNYLNCSTSLNSSDVYIIAVPTPEKDKSCDTRFVKAAAKSISEVAKNGQLVILESTVSPGTCEDIIKPVFDKAGLDLDIVFCPERAIPGNTLYEMIHNDRIIGSSKSSAGEKAEKIYSSFVKGSIFATQIKTAEVAKLMENTFRDVNIALANELHKLLDSMEVDIWEAVKLANLHPRVNILNPGPGVGGHCIAIDPWFLTQNESEDAKAELIKSARKVNDEKPFYTVKKIDQMAQANGVKKIAALGLAYKANVDDCRESPSFTVIEELKKLGHEVKSFDPYSLDRSDVKDFSELEGWADMYVILTAHNCFKDLSFKKVVFDTHNLIG